jgi:hypothetical protein
VNSSQFREWLEVIGIFGVLASLIFVGLQMKQDRTIARATLYQMRSDAVRELMAMQIENRDLTAQYLDPVESLKPEVGYAITAGIMAQISHFENTHNLYQLGLVTKEQWDSDIPLICETLRFYQVQEHWEKSRGTYRESFVEDIENACGDAPK